MKKTMEHALKGKVVAIPSALTTLGTRIVALLLDEESRLGLGAASHHFETLDARLDGREGTYCQPVDLDHPESVKTFFQIVFAQLGQPYVIVLEVLSKNRRLTAEKAIDVGARRLLHCLDAALPYVGRELHLICIATAYGPAAIPVAAAFLATKQSSTGAGACPRVRVSTVSASTGSRMDEDSLARSIVHVMREAQSPDISEAKLLPARKLRRPSPRAATRAKEKIGATLQ
jgi:hypothetical protein